MALPSRALLDDWSAEITEDAVTEMKATISVIDPNSETAPSDYDPETDSGTAAIPTTLLDHRRARAQFMRPPSDEAGAAEWSTRTRMVFQVDLLPGDPFIPKGCIVIVHDGGKDPALAMVRYEVMRAVNSSEAALRTIYTASELAKVTS